MIATRPMPPRKTAGQATGPRRLDGEILDCYGAAFFLGSSEKTVRSRVARRLIPFKRFGGRIVFLRSELRAYLAALDGCDVDEALENVAIRKGKR